MADLSLVKTRILAGIWEGVLSGAPEGDAPPALSVTHLGKEVSTVAVTADDAAPGTWHVRVAIPPELLADGVQTFLIQDAGSGETLDSFAVVAGDPLEDDVLRELDLLRAELDMLKRAFRRHCVETS